MSSKTDVTWQHSLSLANYEGPSPAEALKALYEDTSRLSSELRGWYWTSIRRKRFWSVASRTLGFVFGVIGAIAPIAAAVHVNEHDRLRMTQFGFVALSIAGLVLVGDRVFGWSSGWLRYTATVTTMEQLSTQFELDWLRLLLTRHGTQKEADRNVSSALGDGSVDPTTKPSGADGTSRAPAEPSADDGVVVAAFDIAQDFVQKLGALRTEETQKWIAEFNSGMAVLDEMIKSQREAANRTLETMRETIADKQAGARSGALALTLTRGESQNGHPCKVILDEEAPEQVTGTLWAKAGLDPGFHTVRVVTETNGALKRENRDVVEVAPAQVARHTMVVP